MMDIEFIKCKHLQGTIIEAGRIIELEGGFKKVNAVQYNGLHMTGRKSDITKIINRAIKMYEQYAIELFGKLQYNENEGIEIEYLKSLIK